MRSLPQLEPQEVHAKMVFTYFPDKAAFLQDGFAHVVFIDIDKEYEKECDICKENLYVTDQLTYKIPNMLNAPLGKVRKQTIVS